MIFHHLFRFLCGLPKRRAIHLNMVVDESRKLWKTLQGREFNVKAATSSILCAAVEWIMILSAKHHGTLSMGIRRLVIAVINIAKLCHHGMVRSAEI